MAQPQYGDRQAVMFIAGDDQAANQVTEQLATDLGFEALQVGTLSMARFLEPTAMLWINLALVKGHGRNIAFGILRRE